MGVPSAIHNALNNQTESAIIYCEKNFGKMDGKTANGLVRHSIKYRVIAVIDSDRAGEDSGEFLDGKKNGIPIYRDLSQTLAELKTAPKYFIYGMAPLEGMLCKQERQIMFHAMEKGMYIVNGLHEFLTDDETFVKKAKACNVKIIDIRKPKDKKDLSLFTGRIFDVKCPKIAVLGTDSAIGKRTTSRILTQALCDAGLKAVMVGTGQTALIQGVRYGVVLDAIPEQFISGEMEAALVEAYEFEKPDLIIIEGQGALSHPAYLSSCFIIRGSRPDAIILQHAPTRKTLGDYPKLPMPSVESEIKLLEIFSNSKVIGLALSHENMSEDDLDPTIADYEKKFKMPVTDVLKRGSDKLIGAICAGFPILERKLKRTL